VNVVGSFVAFRRQLVLKNARQNPSISEATTYFDLMANYVTELRTFQKQLRREIRYVLCVIA
jgi:hypothetical protein